MSDSQVTETFRPIQGYPAYRVSDHGRVQSRFVRGPSGLMGDIWRDLKPSMDGSGYHFVVLYGGSGKKSAKVHHLVLYAFVGPRPEGMEACHWDGNRANNLLSNLRWDTNSGNYADRVRHGTDVSGRRNVSAKLTEVQVLEIRRLGSAGMRQQNIADRFGVCRSLVGMILDRKLWDHLPVEPDGMPPSPRLARSRSITYRPDGPADPARVGRGYRTKLKEEDIPRIRGLCDRGLTYREIAGQFGVHRSIISRIDKGRSWAHVT